MENEFGFRHLACLTLEREGDDRLVGDDDTEALVGENEPAAAILEELTETLLLL